MYEKQVNPFLLINLILTVHSQFKLLSAATGHTGDELNTLLQCCSIIYFLFIN